MAASAQRCPTPTTHRRAIGVHNGDCVQFQVTDWVVVLFGTAKKIDIAAVKLKATTPQGLFLEASCPALMFNRAKKDPFTLDNATELLSAASRPTERKELAAEHSTNTRWTTYQDRHWRS